MRTLLAICLPSLLVFGGCPSPQTDSTSTVKAVIAITTTHGNAPLTIVASAAGSTSLLGGDLQYAWDLGDGTTAGDVQIKHTFQQPGRYVVELRVTDQAGQSGTASVDVRVQGSGVVAVIAADPESGRAPLWVQFDGTQSQVPDDKILDYYWDFGDGQTSREAKPRHLFSIDGEYTVQLRVVTAGGLEAQTQTKITVGVRGGSLQFDGGQVATLPLGLPQSLTTCTFEAWVKADIDGGTLATIGDGAVAVELSPRNNTIGLRVSGTLSSATVGNLSGSWHHVAVAYSAADGTGGGGTGGAGTAILYLDGVPILTATAGTPITGGGLTIGLGLRGKVAEVRFWSVARTAADIAGSSGRRLSGGEVGLLGYWPFDEGSGQVLTNHVSGGTNGTLGASTSVESTDPAWSPDGPPL